MPFPHLTKATDLDNPLDPIKARATYVIRTRFHHRAGYPTEWWEERKTSETGFRQIAADILANQITRPLQGRRLRPAKRAVLARQPRHCAGGSWRRRRAARP